MIVLNFDPRASLICLRLTLEATYRRTAVLIFDPGASLTLLTPRLAESLGCQLEAAPQSAAIFTAGGVARARRIRIKSLSLYGEVFAAIEVLCAPLPDGLGADGLLGLDVLRHFKIGLDFQTGTLTFERIV